MSNVCGGGKGTGCGAVFVGSPTIGVSGADDGFRSGVAAVGELDAIAQNPG
jgi:hypothetical protein